jgi:hypothetical protein
MSKRPTFKDHYDNFIGGKFGAPVGGEYYDNDMAWWILHPTNIV